MRLRSSIASILAVAALSVALTAAAASALTKDQLGDKLDRSCETFNRRADKAADRGRTKRQIYAKIYKLQSRFVRKLHRIDPPASLRTPYAKFVKGAERQRGFLKQARDHADDEAALKRIDKKSRKSGRKYQGLAKKLGAPGCAST